jgi:hypothetical protein
MVHGSDSFLPGVEVFGIDPSEVTECNCGGWEPPKKADMMLTRRKLLLHKVQYIVENVDNMDYEMKRWQFDSLIEQVEKVLGVSY